MIPSFSLSTSYDDNLFFQEDRVEDTLSRAGVRFVPDYEGPDLHFQGNYLVQAEIFGKHPDENRITQEGSVQMDLNRWFHRFVRMGEVTMTDDFTLAPILQDYYFDEERRRIGNLSNYGLQTPRTDTFRNAFSLELSVPITRTGTLRSRYGNLLTEYKDPNLTDSLTHTVLIGGARTFAKNTINIDMESSHIRMDKQDSYSHHLSLGVLHGFPYNQSVAFHGGILLLDPETEKYKTTWGGGLSFSRQGRINQHSIGYSRTINTASGLGTSPPVAQIFYLNWRIRFSPKVTTSLDADYAINTSLSGRDLDSTSYNVSAGMTHQPRKWLQTNLTASHFIQESGTSSVADLRRNIISFSLTGTWK